MLDTKSRVAVRPSDGAPCVRALITWRGSPETLRHSRPASLTISAKVSWVAIATSQPASSRRRPRPTYGATSPRDPMPTMRTRIPRVFNGPHRLVVRGHRPAGPRGSPDRLGGPGVGEHETRAAAAGGRDPPLAGDHRPPGEPRGGG